MKNEIEIEERTKQICSAFSTNPFFIFHNRFQISEEKRGNNNLFCSKTTINQQQMNKNKNGQCLNQIKRKLNLFQQSNGKNVLQLAHKTIDI